MAPIQSIGIYSTTNNSNQRSAKCAKTNEKLMKLRQIVDDDEGGEGQRKSEESLNKTESDETVPQNVPGGKLIPLNMMQLPNLREQRAKSRERKASMGSSILGNTIGIRPGKPTRKTSLLRKDDLDVLKKGYLEAHLRKKSSAGPAKLDRSKSTFTQNQQVILLDRFLKQDITKIHIDEMDRKNGSIDENAASQMVMNELIVLERNHHQNIQALLADRLSGGIFYQYLMMNASFEIRSILCLNYIQDLQMLEDCFSLLDKIQKAAAFEAILIKNVPTSETILNELPGIRTHWNYLLKVLASDNNWLTIPWRMYAIKVDAVKLLLVEYARFVRFSREKFIDQLLKSENLVPESKTCLRSSDSKGSDKMRPRSSVLSGELTTAMRRKSILKNVKKYNFQKPAEVEAKFDLEGYEEIESDQDSDEENEKINNKLEKIKGRDINQVDKDFFVDPPPLKQSSKFVKNICQITGNRVFDGKTEQICSDRA